MPSALKREYLSSADFSEQLNISVEGFIIVFGFTLRGPHGNGQEFLPSEKMLLSHGFKLIFFFFLCKQILGFACSNKEAKQTWYFFYMYMNVKYSWSNGHVKQEQPCFSVNSSQKCLSCSFFLLNLTFMDTLKPIIAILEAFL